MNELYANLLLHILNNIPKKETPPQRVLSPKLPPPEIIWSWKRIKDEWVVYGKTNFEVPEIGSVITVYGVKGHKPMEVAGIHSINSFGDVYLKVKNPPKFNNFVEQTQSIYPSTFYEAVFLDLEDPDVLGMDPFDESAWWDY